MIRIMFSVLTVTCLALAMPEAAVAQECDEKCERQLDAEGGHKGYACLIGDEAYECQAEVWHCSYFSCGGPDGSPDGENGAEVTTLLDDEGLLVAVVRLCDGVEVQPVRLSLPSAEET